ncbi:uncharacterized protein LOC120346057 [Styela clava]|uniref:uncharacterized protein LOC120346057 n=1 Tax=Styela clava TaxID=7725 RepID=UPI001939E120|nr:uncharacterized protein LOC120346057 [Styela clava]XP_039271629.1 uncharacterized protein LOC120346057 [Styela clava]XP_039271630.1 uncharacterized protein LOC120346057 [Styela clava]
MLYTASFFKPNWCTMLPSSILFGLCESAVWGASSIMIATAEKSVHREGQGKEGVLYGMKEKYPAELTLNKFSNTSTYVEARSYVNWTTEFLATCASKDCPLLHLSISMTLHRHSAFKI